MASKLTNLETKLDELFVDRAPRLPEGGRKLLVNWLPIVSLLVGILALLSAWNLWHWAHVADNALSGLCNAYSISGCGNLGVTSRFSVWLWLAVLFAVAEGVLYLLAYPGLRARKKDGWNYLFYGALLNVAYAVVNLFTGYNGVSNFLGGLIGSAVGFYFLFQIRDMYAARKDAAAPHTKHPEKK